MAGIEVKEIKSVEITATDGQQIKARDPILICIKGQDVVCRFVELDKSGYFVTKPFVAGKEPVKYRLASITKCYKLTQLVWSDAMEQLEDENGENNGGLVCGV